MLSELCNAISMSQCSTTVSLMCGKRTLQNAFFSYIYLPKQNNHQSHSHICYCNTKEKDWREYIYNPRYVDMTVYISGLNAFPLKIYGCKLQTRAEGIFFSWCFQGVFVKYDIHGWTEFCWVCFHRTLFLFAFQKIVRWKIWLDISYLYIKKSIDFIQWQGTPASAEFNGRPFFVRINRNPH